MFSDSQSMFPELPSNIVFAKPAEKEGIGRNRSGYSKREEKRNKNTCLYEYNSQQ
jgi:hypothetical protein|tara:strand:- start:260 stop:424 length:165 start_codon:yes stop_codon:yes gene_type:complete